MTMHTLETELHSCLLSTQMGSYLVNECSKIVGGQQQHFVTIEGYTIPITINSGLTSIHPVCIPSDHDLQTLPYVLFTSPQE